MISDSCPKNAKNRKNANVGHDLYEKRVFI